MAQPISIFISAGEASGDLYGSLLIRALSEKIAGARFYGCGGEKMRQAGCETVVDAREVTMVGIVEVIGEYRPDPTDEAGKFGLVDVKAVKDMPRPVTLAEVKATPALAEMSLVKSFRLSVQPVTPREWKLVCKMGELKA